MKFSHRTCSFTLYNNYAFHSFVTISEYTLYLLDPHRNRRHILLLRYFLLDFGLRCWWCRRRWWRRGLCWNKCQPKHIQNTANMNSSGKIEICNRRNSTFMWQCNNCFCYLIKAHFSCKMAVFANETSIIHKEKTSGINVKWCFSSSEA